MHNAMYSGINAINENATADPNSGLQIDVRM